MAKFRNLLVHLYRKVDDEKVFEIINKDISIVRKHLQAIDTYAMQQIDTS